MAQKPQISPFVHGLLWPTWACYKDKVEMCDGVDPHKLCIGVGATSDSEFLPATTHAYDFNYLMMPEIFYITLQEMNVYNSLHIQNYFG